jgi:hypothetical protein
MSGRIQPNQLADIFNASEEGKAYDARTGNTGGITTIGAGTTTVGTGGAGTTTVGTGTGNTGGITTIGAGTTTVGTGGAGTTNVATAGGLTRAQVEALVDKTYLDETGRASTFNDPGGRAYYIDLLMSGRIQPNQLADIFNASEEGKAFDARNTTNVTTAGGLTLAQVEALVDKTYLEETGRASTFNDPDGRAYYINEIMSGRIPPDQLAKELSKSTEGRNFDLDNLSKGLLTVGYVDPTLTAKLTRIKDLYKTELGRDPDEAGLRYYLSQEDENYDFNKAVTVSPEALVRDAFKRVFNREPSASDQAYYIDELKKGRTYDQIVSDLRGSDEYQTKVGIVEGPGDVLYSNPATAARARTDFAGFPLVSKAGTDKLELNLPDREDFSLGLKDDVFQAYTPTVYAESPYASNIFGGPSTAAQDYSNLGIGTTSGITSLADVTKVASASPFTLGNTMANNLGANLGTTAGTNLGTTAGTNLDLTSNAGTIGMAEGGMVMSDPVMRRAMVRRPGPVSSKGYGITSNVTTPDENAMAMQTMFQPQGFKDGGPVQYFQEGGEAVEERAPLTFLERFRGTPAERQRAAARAAEATEERVPLSLMERFRGTPTERQRAEARAAESPPAEESNFRKVMGEVTGGIGGFLGPVVSRAGQILRGGSRSGSGASSTSEERRAALQTQANAQMRQAIDDRDATDREGLTRVSEDRRTQTSPPDPGRKAPVRDRLTIRLDELKAEREANKAQRRENQLLALMQAGFAAAAGRSPNALANIAAGGASGVTTLADLEKGRRAEDTALRREILETELTGERMRETAAEREAARQDRALSREQTGLRSQAEINARREGQIENTRLRLEALVKDPVVPETEKVRYRAQIEALDKELERRAVEESRLSRAILPPGMRQESGGFPARVVGSSPTPQR